MYLTTCAAAVRHSLINSESKIESVAKVEGEEGGVLIKITKASEGLVDRLRTTFPLATIALAEDLVGSSACAHVLFPAEAVQRSAAVDISNGMRLVRLLVSGSNMFFVLAALVFATSVASGAQRSL